MASHAASASLPQPHTDADFDPPSLPLTTIGLSLATFMTVLDTTIANVSLPTMAGELGKSYDQSTWIITSFTVCMAIMLPLTGFLSRRFGEVKLFTWCTVVFSLASLMCGLSTSMSELLLFRAIQGAASGPLYPVTQSLMIATYPKAKRGIALSLIGMITIVAPIIGPMLGGWITDDYSWHWIFFINVPIGIVASIVVAAQLGGMEMRTERPRMDYVGLTTLIVGVGALQIVLDKGNEDNWFQSPFIVGTAIASAIALTVFLIWELTDDDPIVDLRLFRHRNFAVGTLAMVLAYSSFFAMSVLLPLWMQRVLSYTAIWAGIAAAPIGIIPLLTVYVVGKYGPRVDLRWLAAFSFLAFGATSFMNAQFDTQVDFGSIAAVRLFQGLGVALFFMPVLAILLSDLEGREVTSGSGTYSFFRQLGASFSTSIVTFVWDNQAATSHAQLGEHINPYNPVFLDSPVNHAFAGHRTAELAYLNRSITLQGFQISFNQVMEVLALILFLLVPLIFLAKPPFIRQRVGPPKRVGTGSASRVVPS